MTLTEDLKAFSAEMVTKIPEKVRGILGDAMDALSRSGIAGRIIKKGEKAPEIKLLNAHGRLVDVDDLLEKGPVVLVFYRGGWCPYCNLELKAYQAKKDDFHAEGAQLVAISPEMPDNSLSVIEKNALGFEILSDAGLKVAENFGLVFDLPEEVVPVYQDFGIDLEKANADTGWRLPVPATFILDKERVIRFVAADIDYTKRAEPEEVIAALKKL